jgi:hypothetical protein
VGRTTIGALCSSYVNSGNLGIPIAVYVLGDASLVAPVLLFQLVGVTPVALTVLDLASGGEKRPLWQRLLTPLRNPIALGSLAGVAVSASGRTLPGPLMDPLTLIGNMSVPAVLLAFGISLRGSTLPLRGAERAPVLLAVALKSVVQPLVAWALAVTVFDLRGALLLDVVVGPAGGPEPVHLREQLPGGRGAGEGGDPVVDGAGGARVGGGGGVVGVTQFSANSPVSSSRPKGSGSAMCSPNLPASRTR